MSRWFELIMSNDSSVGKTIYPDRVDFGEIDPAELTQGKWIDGWNSNSVARSTDASRDGDTEDVVFADLAMVPLFSPRLRAALDDADVGTKDIQYLPVRILQSTGKTIEGFVVANVVTRVAALDRARCYLIDDEESELDPRTGLPKINSIFTIAVHADLFSNHDAARLIEFPRAMLVSERLVEVFSQNGFTGVHFSELIQ